MRKIYLGIMFLLFVLGALLLFVSCGELEEEIDGKTVSSLSISPISATVEIGATQAFSVTAVYSDDSTGSLHANWSVTGGIGNIITVGFNALFTATATGSGTVEAGYGGKYAIASVTVTAATGEVIVEAGVLATIEVTSAVAAKIFRVGALETFAASGKDGSGEAMDISPTWEISGDAIGVFSAIGTDATLEVTAEGTARISCTSGEVVGYSYVTVEGYVTEITAEVDTYVSSPESGAHGSESILKSGRMTVPSTELYETYIIFNISFIPPDSTIEAAKLKLYCGSTDGAAMNIGLLAQSWEGSTIWATRPSKETFVLAKIFVYGVNEVDEVDFKDGVQHWLDTDNHGIVIYLDDPAVGFANFVSRDEPVYLERRPTLQLEYITP